MVSGQKQLSKNARLSTIVLCTLTSSQANWVSLSGLEERDTQEYAGYQWLTTWTRLLLLFPHMFIQTGRVKISNNFPTICIPWRDKRSQERTKLPARLQLPGSLNPSQRCFDKSSELPISISIPFFDIWVKKSGYRLPQNSSMTIFPCISAIETTFLRMILVVGARHFVGAMASIGVARPGKASLGPQIQFPCGKSVASYGSL